MFSGDGHTVENRNEGIVAGDYFAREYYQETFRRIFDRLHADGLFVQTRLEIINQDLYKLSPFKELSPEQDESVRVMAEAVLADITADSQDQPPSPPMVVTGGPGTGKTVLAVVLMKLLADLATQSDAELEDLIQDGRPFSDLFTRENRDRLQGLRLGLVVPQQSLRKSIKNVFKRTPGLSADQVVDPFAIGLQDQSYDVLIVDEAHRLSQRANQSAAMHNARFREITEKLFGADDLTRTQLDWIRARSRHQVLILDPQQTVRPADLPRATVDALITGAESQDRLFTLQSQLRVNAGDDYVEFFGSALRATRTDGLPQPPEVGDYDLRMFTDLGQMRDELLRLDGRHGLSRLLAGFAWPWKSKKDKTATDISIDGLDLRWNSTATDWVGTQNSRYEVGSIHTIQGYDLNYAGVIIGPDLSYDERTGRVVFNRDSYFDVKGKENNSRLKIEYTDEQIREYVINVYNVLLTRGIRGTFLYVCDEPLRKHLASTYFPGILSGASEAPFVGTSPKTFSDFAFDPDPRAAYAPVSPDARAVMMPVLKPRDAGDVVT
ncbi:MULTISPECIES: DNA/RNA helicase domain-containing protein [Citricoccus]|uniref:DNA/RNA helicase domain-containing protein n=1 Tax=Citricoccus TaxID=169133 RepID=UPI000255EFD2|nr:DNA/RNA helicase domain-containing protein [Citricoccus sp. CH26A]